MRLYDSTLPDGSRRLIVHLDERQKVREGDPRLDQEDFPAAVGQPDPEWCVEAVHPPYDEANPPMTGAESEWDLADGDPPMRAMAREEVETQQEREVVAIAREELARRRAEEQQAQAAAADPFAGGGRSV